jgi:FkbH-like protein
MPATAVLYYFSLRNMENLVRLFIYRNFTVEPLFARFKNARFSGYGDVTAPPEDADLLVWMHQLPLDAASDGEAEAAARDLKNRLDLLLKHDSKASAVLFTLHRFFHTAYESSSCRLARAIAAYNEHLYDCAEKNKRLKVIDLSEFAESACGKPLIDWKYYYISKMLINPALSGAFHEWFTGHLSAINASRKKCIVLDCDNTLWGGIVGEDGLEGIGLGTDYPGSAYKDFQRGLKEAAGHGVLLALCSKNNENDVWEVFEKHPDMALRKEDIAAFRINWNDKAANITEIARELNIGVDSMVVIDDNPAERELIRRFLPGTPVPEFPDQPYKLIIFLKTFYEEYFRIYSLTDEDRTKTEQYRQNARRKSDSGKFASLSEYLNSLGMTIKIDPVSTFNLPRIVQLTQKTNQFNLTTRRYTESDLRNFTDRGDLVVCASVSDRFGDSGITAACIIAKTGDGRAAINSYLLSCRILGHGIEDAFLKVLLNHLLLSGIRDVSAEYLPTRKNMQTEMFYEKFGFAVVALENGAKRYRLSLRNEYPVEPYYTIVSSLGKTDEQ